MTKIKVLAVAVISCLFTAGLVSQNISHATVPKVNELISLSSGSTQGDVGSTLNAISADGRYVAFYSDATNLVASDTNSKKDIFARDRISGTTTRVSVSSSGTQANGDSNDPAISYDGRYVVFSSKASNLVSNDGNETGDDVFLRDLSNGTTELISVATTGIGGDYGSRRGAISADGRFVVFISRATNLVSGISSITPENVYVRDRLNNVTTLISKDSSGTISNNWSDIPSISCDGGIIVFETDSTNLVSGDTNASRDIVVVQRAGGDSFKNITKQGNNSSLDAEVSCDGNYVSFTSWATNLDASDTNGYRDIYRYSRVDDTLKIASKSSAGVLGNQVSVESSISGDGRYITYSSSANNLISGDSNGVADIFIRDMETSTTELLTINSASQLANYGSYGPHLSSNGKYVSYYTASTNLIASDANGTDGDVLASQTGY